MAGRWASGGHAWVLGLAVMLAGSARAQGPVSAAADASDDDVPTVIVTPDDPLVESDRKLAALIKGLPGADDPVAARRSVGQKIGDWAREHGDPNTLSADSQQRMQRAIEGDPAHPNLQ